MGRYSQGSPPQKKHTPTSKVVKYDTHTPCLDHFSCDHVPMVPYQAWPLILNL